MSKQSLEKSIEALEMLRFAPEAVTAREQLCRALSNRNNYLVSRAARLASDLKFEDLIPELLTTFDRLFVDPVKSDPQCLAKSAIAKALRELGHRGAPAYLRGIAHFQFEPTWGGRADSAATLRGTCALALTDCLLDDLEILTYLVDALADPDKVVRIESAVAISQLGRMEGALLLRLKLLTGDSEPAVLGQCFASFLNLAPADSVPFVSRFLRSTDADVQLEAASALAHCRAPEAIEVLQEFWDEPLISLELRRVLLIDLGASPLREAAEFLLSVVAHAAFELASNAVTALATSRFHAEMRERVATAVGERDLPTLRSVFEQTFGPA